MSVLLGDVESVEVELFFLFGTEDLIDLCSPFLRRQIVKQYAESTWSEIFVCFLNRQCQVAGSFCVESGMIGAGFIIVEIVQTDTLPPD